MMNFQTTRFKYSFNKEYILMIRLVIINLIGILLALPLFFCGESFAQPLPSQGTVVNVDGDALRIEINATLNVNIGMKGYIFNKASTDASRDFADI
jgi:hypothetical protein